VIRRVWDLPTRLFHWLLVVLVAFSWWSAENREMDWHRWSGSIVLGLLVFRLIWGLIGGSTARFGQFLRRPGAVAAYLRSGPAEAPAGHNPLGGYAVLAMLLVVLAQVGTGLFAVDVDGLESGPLSFLVSFDQGRIAAGVHEVSFNLLLGLIALHLLAITFYTFVRKQALLRRMITGNDTGDGGGLVPASPLWLVVAAALAGALAWWVNRGMGL
jgi:cytochrome b